jgi:hypothetical protein
MAAMSCISCALEAMNNSAACAALPCTAQRSTGCWCLTDGSAATVLDRRMKSSGLRSRLSCAPMLELCPCPGRACCWLCSQVLVQQVLREQR